MNKMNKAIKFNTPFETIRFSNTTPEGKLRKAIIIQAMIDATNLGDDATSRQIAEEAREWIFGKDDSFVLMCHQSGLEPDYIARKTKEAMDYHANSIRKESRCKERVFENMEALSA